MIKILVVGLIISLSCTQRCTIEFQGVAFKLPVRLCNKTISDSTSQDSQIFRRLLHIESESQVLTLSKEVNYPDGININQDYLDYQLNHLKTINKDVEVKTAEINTANRIKRSTIFYLVSINSDLFGIFWISFVFDKFLFVIKVQMPFYYKMEEDLRIIGKTIHFT